MRERINTMTRVRIYSDFDGTISNRAGSKAVFTEFYQSLLQGYTKGVTQDYKNTPMKNPQEVHSLLTAKFGAYDQHFNHSQEDVDFLISPEALRFFHELLKNDQVSIIIVTKNRTEYIKALFKFQGFSDEELNKLSIFSSGFKFEDIDSHCKMQTEKPERVYLFEDSAEDFSLMMNAVKANGFKEEEIRGYHKKPGYFSWLEYLKDILKFAPPSDFKSKDKVNNYSSIRRSDALGDRDVLKKIDTFCKIGLVFGLLLGVILIATGVLAPAGFLALFGTLIASSVVGGGIGLLAGFITFDRQKTALNDQQEDDKTNSIDALIGLSSSSSLNKHQHDYDNPVHHYPSVLSAPPAKTDITEARTDKDSPTKAFKV